MELEAQDTTRDTIVALCQRYGHTPLILDAAADSLFAEHLRDPATRAHFPLLCVRGTLIGGLEVIRGLESTGRLETLLAGQQPASVPVIALSQTAAQVIKAALSGPEACLRIVISADFDHDIVIDAAKPDDMSFLLGDIPCVLDPESVTRADGLAIEWVDDGDTKGFRIDNPNRPEPVRYVDGNWVNEQLATIQPLLVIDVRSKSEYEVSHLPGAVALDTQLIDTLEQLDPHVPLFFYCKNGVKKPRRRRTLPPRRLPYRVLPYGADSTH